MWEAGWFSKAGNGPFTAPAQPLGLSEQNFLLIPLIIEKRFNLHLGTAMMMV
jgi:hypothetical protein